MADRAAVIALRSGGNDWLAYCDAHAGTIIDLRLADLVGLNLGGRSLSHCDLSGADLTDANLDSCDLADCVLVDSVLESISLVGGSIRRTNMSRALLRHATIRGVRLDDVTLDEADCYDLRLHGVTLDNSSISNIASGAKLFADGCVFRECEIERVELGPSFAIDSATFSRSRIRGMNCVSGRIAGIRLEDSTLSDVRLTGTPVTELDGHSSEFVKLSLDGGQLNNSRFSNCLIDSAIVAELSPGETPMVNCTLVRCTWPKQSPCVSWLGRYAPAAGLLAQPVQDLSGLAPRLRREIADAQYLEQLHGEAGSRLRRAGLRLWGASTMFGQSLRRLTMWTSTLIAILALGLPLADGSASSLSNAPGALRQAAQVTTMSFLGLDTDLSGRYVGAQAVVVFVARLLGFFVLGLWIGVAANKLGRLSSE